MLHALKMDNVVKDNVLMEDVKLVSLKVNPEHSVTDMKIVQEREKLPAVLGVSPLTLLPFISLLTHFSLSKAYGPTLRF